ncbi:MAG TPA: SGNH/GDSL hydrolase family protein [Polyangiaceae bacterium]|nr:SGNH/GDSL hydrolase family protein [Polyangiaceae bacterium]
MQKGQRRLRRTWKGAGPFAIALLPCWLVACGLSTNGTESGSGGGGTGGAGGTNGVSGAGGVGGSTADSGDDLGGSGGSAGAAASGSVDSGGAGRGGSASGGAAGTEGTRDGGRGGQSGAGQGGAGQGGAGANSGGASGTSGARDGGGAGGSAGAGREGGADSSITDGGLGGDGSAGFRPCPTSGDPCRILPLGDSITWGIQYDGAYRVELFSKAVAAGQKITFTGSLSNGPDMVSGMAFPKSNEGHSGWTIAQVTGLVPTPAFATAPHIVLLTIGTNDIYAASGQSTMPDRLGSLVDKIIEAAPNALLLVAKITPLSNANWNQTIATYNGAIPGIVQTRAAAGKHVMLADMNTGFTSSMLSTDGIHPNKSGYDFMGDVWYAALSNLLPK